MSLKSLLSRSKKAIYKIRMNTHHTDITKNHSNICKLKVAASTIPGGGQGLFAEESICENETICYYTGDIINFMTVLKKKNTDYIMGGFGLNYHVDATNHPEVLARYINDNGDESTINCRFEKNKTEKYARVVSLKNIDKGDELFASYGRPYWNARGRVIQSTKPKSNEG